MTALTEIKNVQQIAGESRRRWFSSADIDLIVWYEDGGSLIGFQLCYDKNTVEHAFYWRPDSGYGHMAVDDGEQNSVLNYKETPILVADGQIDANRIHNLFAGSCENLPTAVIDFVERKIMQHPNYVHRA